jgi:hypothetical protein
MSDVSEIDKEQIRRHVERAIALIDSARSRLNQALTEVETGYPTPAAIMAGLARDALKEATSRVEGVILNLPK